MTRIDLSPCHHIMCLLYPNRFFLHTTIPIWSVVRSRCAHSFQITSQEKGQWLTVGRRGSVIHHKQGSLGSFKVTSENEAKDLKHVWEICLDWFLWCISNTCGNRLFVLLHIWSMVPLMFVLWLKEVLPCLLLQFLGAADGGVASVRGESGEVLSVTHWRKREKPDRKRTMYLSNVQQPTGCFNLASFVHLYQVAMGIPIFWISPV